MKAGGEEKEKELGRRIEEKEKSVSCTALLFFVCFFLFFYYRDGWQATC